MKLMIDIPDYEYRQIKEIYEKNDIVENTYSYIYHGTPLDDVKKEIFKLIDNTDSIYGTSALHSVLEILDNIGKSEKGGE